MTSGRTPGHHRGAVCVALSLLAVAALGPIACDGQTDWLDQILPAASGPQPGGQAPAATPAPAIGGLGDVTVPTGRIPPAAFVAVEVRNAEAQPAEVTVGFSIAGVPVRQTLTTLGAAGTATAAVIVGPDEADRIEVRGFYTLPRKQPAAKTAFPTQVFVLGTDFDAGELIRCEVSAGGSPPSPPQPQPPAPGGILYVDAGAPPGGDGASWATAYTKLQDALATAAGSPGAVAEIWVAAGPYTPTDGTDRTATFRLVHGVTVYGGFVGNETDRTDRDPSRHVTILSGDIGAGEGNSDNSYHVVTAVGVNAGLDGVTVRDGHANGSGDDAHGAGVFVDGGQLALTNSRLADNHAANQGGGLFARNASINVGESQVEYNQASVGGGLAGSGATLALSDTTVSDNTASSSAGGVRNTQGTLLMTDCLVQYNTVPSGAAWPNGGGVQNVDGTGSRFIRCTFADNSAHGDGGAMANSQSSPLLSGCVFVDNTAVSDAGGALVNHTCSPTLVNCEFYGNSTYWAGGAIYNYGASPTITNGVFSGNRTTAYSLGGGAIHNQTSTASTPSIPSQPVITNCSFTNNEAFSGEGSALYSRNGSSATVVNSILWRDLGEGEISGPATVSYSLVEGSYSGTGNLDADPLFADADGADDMPGTPDDDLRVTRNSPAIDAGNNDALPADLADLDNDANVAEPIPSDLAGLARRLDDATKPDTGNGTAPLVDMGAYEFDNPETPLGTQLTSSTANETQCAWDPAGNTLAYVTNVRGISSVNDIGAVQADGSNEGLMLIGRATPFGVGNSPSWVGSTGMMMVEERVFFHEYLAFNTAGHVPPAAAFNRTTQDGNDAACTRKLVIDGGGGGLMCRVSRDGSTVLWRFSSSGGSGLVSIKTAPYAALTGQSASTGPAGTVTHASVSATSGYAHNFGAALTPDGTTFVLAVLVNPNDHNQGVDLWRYNTDGSGSPVQLTTSGADAAVWNRFPDLSPDGTTIAYSTTDGGAADIWLMDLDGSNKRRLTTSCKSQYWPTWSPDGSKIAFAQYDSDAASPSYNLYVASVPLP